MRFFRGKKWKILENKFWTIFSVSFTQYLLIFTEFVVVDLEKMSQKKVEIKKLNKNIKMCTSQNYSKRSQGNQKREYKYIYNR